MFSHSVSNVYDIRSVVSSSGLEWNTTDIQPPKKNNSQLNRTINKKGKKRGGRLSLLVQPQLFFFRSLILNQLFSSDGCETKTTAQKYLYIFVGRISLGTMENPSDCERHPDHLSQECSLKNSQLTILDVYRTRPKEK